MAASPSASTAASDSDPVPGTDALAHLVPKFVDVFNSPTDPPQTNAAEDRLKRNQARQMIKEGIAVFELEGLDIFSGPYPGNSVLLHELRKTVERAFNTLDEPGHARDKRIKDFFDFLTGEFRDFWLKFSEQRLWSENFAAHGSTSVFLLPLGPGVGKLAHLVDQFVDVLDVPPIEPNQTSNPLAAEIFRLDEQAHAMTKGGCAVFKDDGLEPFAEPNYSLLKTELIETADKAFVRINRPESQDFFHTLVSLLAEQRWSSSWGF